MLKGTLTFWSNCTRRRLYLATVLRRIKVLSVKLFWLKWVLSTNFSKSKRRSRISSVQSSPMSILCCLSCATASPSSLTGVFSSWSGRYKSTMLASCSYLPSSTTLAPTKVSRQGALITRAPSSMTLTPSRSESERIQQVSFLHQPTEIRSLVSLSI